VNGSQKPLELIHARNLIASIFTPAFLVSTQGLLEYYNDAAATLFGRPFEDTGRVSAERWGAVFGPFDETGRMIPFDEIDLVAEMRAGRAGHSAHRIASLDGKPHEVLVTLIPVAGEGEFSGAMVFFWPTGQ
jgi:PAS domain-containing protein